MQNMGARNVPMIAASASTQNFQSTRSFSGKSSGGLIMGEGDDDDLDGDYEPMELSEALASEIAVEAADDTIDAELEECKTTILNSFNITDIKGKGIVTLTSKNTTISGETIVIQFDCQDEADNEVDNMEAFENLRSTLTDTMEDEEIGNGNGDDNDEDDSLNFGINFTVTITKNDTGNKILVDCVAGQQIQISNIQYLNASASANANADDEEIEAYGGPVFDQLEESLQDAFYDYLEDRGINDDMCFFVLTYSGHKEQQEYKYWLNNLLQFVEKK